jgi:hypothetical protein
MGLDDDPPDARWRASLGQRESNLAVRWVAGALVVLAVAIVSAALIVSQRPVNVHVDGQLTVCTTISLHFANTCR